MPHSGLSRSSRVGFDLRRILTVLNNIEVKATQLTATKVVNTMKYLMELIGIVGCSKLDLQVSCTATDPTIEGQ